VTQTATTADRSLDTGLLESIGSRIGPQPRRFDGALREITHPLASGRYQSPLRYPGAKSGLATVIGELIESATASRQVKNVDLLVEPFAGGASTSLRLVGAGIVDRILLADADPMVAAFWQVAAARTDDLIDRINCEHATYVAPGGNAALDRWDFWRAWRPRVGASANTTRLELAVKCLFLNRTTFSGILHGQAGPIGGRSQSSKYDIGCRFNVEALTERLRFVGHLYETHRLVDVWCRDWRDTLDDVAEWYPTLLPDRVVAYLDPPYIAKSGKLYPRSFDKRGASGDGRDLDWFAPSQHFALAQYLRCEARFRWVLSYDADRALLTHPGLYAANRMKPAEEQQAQLGVRCWRISKRLVTLSYTASARKGRGAAEELLLTTLPPATVPSDERLLAVERLLGSKPHRTR